MATNLEVMINGIKLVHLDYKHLERKASIGSYPVQIPERALLMRPDFHFASSPGITFFGPQNGNLEVNGFYDLVRRVHKAHSNLIIKAQNAESITTVQPTDILIDYKSIESDPKRIVLPSKVEFPELDFDYNEDVLVPNYGKPKFIYPQNEERNSYKVLIPSSMMRS